MSHTADFDGRLIGEKAHDDACWTGRGRASMKNRVIRVPDHIWEGAQAAAVARDERLSEEIRKFLESYGRDYRKQGR